MSKWQFLFDDLKVSIITKSCNANIKVLVNGILDFLKVDSITSKVRYFDKFNGGWSKYQLFELKHYDAESFNDFYFVDSCVSQNYVDGYVSYVATPPEQVYNYSINKKLIRG